MQILKKQGIYAIVNQTTNKIYIGSSVDVKRRYYQHKTNLSKGKAAKSLQADYNTGNKFCFVPLVYADDISPELLFAIENSFIKQINPIILYNSSNGVVRAGWRNISLHKKERDNLKKLHYPIPTDAIASLCGALDCQPGDILEYVPGNE